MSVNTAQLIRDARADLKECVTHRDRFDARITELRILLRTLVRFVPEDSQRQEILSEIEAAKRKAPSLTDSILNLLKQSKKMMTSNDIREQLEASGFDLDEYSQPLATIQSTLQRLVDSGSVKRDLAADKSVLYGWNPDAPPRRGALANAFAQKVREAELEAEAFGPPRKTFGQHIGENRSAFYGGEGKTSMGEQVRKALNYHADKKK